MSMMHSWPISLQICKSMMILNKMQLSSNKQIRRLMSMMKFLIEIANENDSVLEEKSYQNMRQFKFIPTIRWQSYVLQIKRKNSNKQKAIETESWLSVDWHIRWRQVHSVVKLETTAANMANWNCAQTQILSKFMVFEQLLWQQRKEKDTVGFVSVRTNS